MHRKFSVPILAAGVLFATCAVQPVALTKTASAAAPSAEQALGRPVLASLSGVHKIQHVVVIMQENHSFDNYFGAYPGADGIPMGSDGTPSVCVPDPQSGLCVKPFHDSKVLDDGGPHRAVDATRDINGGKMDGFIAQQMDGRTRACLIAPVNVLCKQAPLSKPDVMGYHDAREIPNYWTYAQQFVLQDHMFAPAASFTLPSHLFMVSGWSAKCSNGDPMSCKSEISNPDLVANRNGATGGKPDPYAWTDLTYMLHQAGVSWAYYVTPGSQPDCENDDMACPSKPQSPYWDSMVNPMPGFQTVHDDHQLGNIQSTDNFLQAAQNGTLPAVSWIVPDEKHSEHPPNSIKAGMGWVTSLVNAVMSGPNWDSTAIFLTWDEWGGFYDHVTPPSVDNNGYGIRVPGLIVSPYARRGYIDHQTLTVDAYVKFIEDDFLASQRLDPTTDGRPDARTVIRETAPGLGNLMAGFDFDQQARPPLLLDTSPAPGPACEIAPPLPTAKTPGRAVAPADGAPVAPVAAPAPMAAAGTCKAK
ncbi:MAG: alkaline phosphatase family protein [Chloroflexota bacterium]